MADKDADADVTEGLRVPGRRGLAGFSRGSLLQVPFLVSRVGRGHRGRLLEHTQQGLCF